jgi:hypothetical protein
MFQRRLHDGALSPERTLASEPLWAEIRSFVSKERKQGVTSNDLRAIAGRSAEFDAVNQLLNQGAKSEDIVLSTTVLPIGPDVTASPTSVSSERTRRKPAGASVGRETAEWRFTFIC